MKYVAYATYPKSAPRRAKRDEVFTKEMCSVTYGL